MSTGEPTKRQKIESKDPIESSNISLKNLSQNTKLAESAELARLSQENARLSSENNKLNDYISKHNSSWKKLVRDINALCQAYSYEKFDGSSPFSFLIQDEEGLSQMSELTRGGFRQLLGVISKLKSGIPQDEIGKKNSELTDSYVKACSDISEYQREIQRLKDTLSRTVQEQTRTEAIADDLKSTNQSLTTKLSAVEIALKCKCPCRCGARKSEAATTEEDSQDIKELKNSLGKLQDERDHLKTNLEEQIQRAQKMQIELEVSEERFVRTKAFRSLIAQAKTMIKNHDTIKKKNEELQKINDEFNEAKEREIAGVIAEEEKKILALYEEIGALKSKNINIAKERDEARFEYEALKRDKNTQRDTEHFQKHIEELEQQKLNLKKKIADLKKDKLELENKSMEDLKVIYELKDNLHLKEIEISNMKTVPDENVAGENEIELDVRLKEQRNQILELKQHAKAKDHIIAKLEGQVKHLKQEVKNERKNNENLINEIEVTGNAYEETMKKNKVLVNLLDEKEKNHIQLMNERVKESNWKTLREKEKLAYEAIITNKDETIAKLKDVVKEAENKLKFQSDFTSSLESKLKTFEDRLRHYYNQNEEVLRKNEELMIAKKEWHDKLLKTEKLSIKSATDAIQFQLMYQQAVKQMKIYEEKWCKAKEYEKFTSANDIINNELTKYRNMVRCSICCARPKDALITKCFHTFCRKCLEDNIANKKRKCPTCLGKYTLDDVKGILWK
ncbi:Bre1 [Blepharisma stoltei]|uniref:E3 ubiquitin protein ligase n=1 Tax=Blepharisma stoltei TaxID=1481888 RepID=A0AAU9IP64_9CILI|nr:unnamed protein product [Blepharisma stoltei]